MLCYSISMSSFAMKEIVVPNHTRYIRICHCICYLSSLYTLRSSLIIRYISFHSIQLIGTQFGKEKVRHSFLSLKNRSLYHIIITISSTFRSFDLISYHFYTSNSHYHIILYSILYQTIQCFCKFNSGTNQGEEEGTCSNQTTSNNQFKE